MKKAAQILSLFLFVLLQCVAPLAHAHIDSGSMDHHAHMHGVHTQFSDAINIAGHTVHEGITVHEQNCPSIETPQVYKCDDGLNIADVSAPLLYISLLPTQATTCFDITVFDIFIPPAPYHRPHSQAPPALA
ncbi:MAG: hypothetical protein PHF20_07955 [Halothiobacillaceae bacterium]|jgi:hypothetical protein|nr:hypothetical protein [Halothiobacillaceae bacterium]